MKGYLTYKMFSCHNYWKDLDKWSILENITILKLGFMLPGEWKKKIFSKSLYKCSGNKVSFVIKMRVLDVV
jgi:hypothetical protein